MLLDILPTAEQRTAARERMTTWWAGGDLGRPALDLTSRRAKPDLPPCAEPANWTTDYAARELAWRVHRSQQQIYGLDYHAEAMPGARPCVGPCSLAGLLGSTIAEAEDTVWVEPCLNDEEPDPAACAFDPDNIYWQFITALAERQLALDPDAIKVGYPDLGEGLDIFAAMRGSERMFFDFFDRPEWVDAWLARIDLIQAQVFDDLARRLQQDDGSLHNWMWAPGPRTGRFQCDTLAMLSPDDGRRWLEADLRRWCDRHDHRIFHWDGVSALVHEEMLLGVEGLDVIQWVPGAGEPMVHDPRWWPLYDRILAAGKQVALVGFASVSQLVVMKERFGDQWHRFFLRMQVRDSDTAEAIIESVSI